MLSLLLSLGLAARAVVAAADSTELRGEALISALRNGGYTILLRHARTDYTVKEALNRESLPRAEQRNLNDDGVRDAKLIRRIMTRYAVPIGEILSSQLFRTRETAEYAFGEPVPHVELQQLDPSPAQRALILAPPKPGTNRVIVTHHFIIERYAPGIRPGEIGESEAAVVKPSGDGGLTLVGRFTRTDWTALAPAETPEPVASPSARPNGPPPAWPGTRAGRLAEGYLRAFNSGSPAMMREFIEQFMVTNPARPTGARIESYQKLFDQLGPLVLVSIRSSADDSIAVVTRSKQGEVQVTVTTSADQPSRASSVAFAIGGPGQHP